MYELVSPVNRAAVLKYTAQLLIGIGGVMAVPFTVAIVFGSLQVAAVYGIMALVLISGGYAIHRLLPTYELEWKEALVIAALIFPLSSLISAIPIAISTGMAPFDAFFEAVSGLTTTGLSVAPADAGPVFLFARSWLQWIGGIGIVLIVLSIPLIQPGTSALRLYTINVGEKLRPSVATTAILLAKIYLIITILAIILLLVGGMAPFDAVCHALSSVSTGGFSTRQDSIAAFSGFFLPGLVIFSCIIGSVNFALYPRLLNAPKTFFSSSQFITFLCIGIAGTGILFCTLPGTGTFLDTAGIAAFQAFSALSTAGFANIDIGLLPDSSKAVLTLLMWIGGSVGSTAGGIKILRIIILFKVIQLVFVRFFLPREALTPLKVRNEVLEPDEINIVLAFVILYIMVLIASSFIFMLHGFGMVDSLFEVSSALGTVGLSTGVTGASMPIALKAVLIVDMLLGRIEIIPIFMLFLPRTWVDLGKSEKKAKIAEKKQKSNE